LSGQAAARHPLLGVALATEGTQEISYFFFDSAKVQKIQCASKLFFKKSTQKSTL
jgi:hypothetical protein